MASFPGRGTAERADQPYKELILYLESDGTTNCGDKFSSTRF